MDSKASTSLVWFRLDLRLGDNPALMAAVNAGGPVIPVFVHAPDEEAPWAPGSASRWWLHQSLCSLEAELRGVGSRLILRRGPALQALQALLRETGAGRIFWNRRYEPGVIKRDAAIKAALGSSGIEAESFNAALLREPWEIQNKSARPFQVFTPFWRNCLAAPEPPPPAPAPRSLPAPRRWPESLAVESLELEPRIDWAGGLRGAWQPGEGGARAELKRFLAGPLLHYDAQRDLPAQAGTSRLSPHLHFGEIGPRQVWHATRRAAEQRGVPEAAWRRWQFLAELGWREFAHHLLFHFPHTPEQPLRTEFARFPWRRNPEWLEAWQRGRTGYPLVDAGMRELWATGWMHNRVRMVAASFLVKHLQVSWNDGARWFWDTLVDGDLASNTLGWQWAAGCGADAAPYFRIFNPVIQGEKFDPRGGYVRRWVPEIAGLPDRWLHQPWNAPASVLAAAGLELGGAYPRPIVSHVIAREVALEAYARLRKGPLPTAWPARQTSV